MTETTLYFSHQPTRSARARWAFIEAGVPFKGVGYDVFKGEHKNKAYLALNPLGYVPTATFDGVPVFESSALAFIAATEGTGLLAQAGSPKWRQALQWAVFAPAELDRLLATLNVHRLFRPPEQRSPEVVKETMETWNARADAVTTALANQRYLLGDEFSIADVCVGHSIMWARMHDILVDHAQLQAYLDRLQERGAFKEVYGPEPIGTFPDPHAT